MRFFNPISFRSEALNKKTTDNKGKKSGHTTRVCWWSEYQRDLGFALGYV